MDSWLATELDVILLDEVIEQECLKQLPFFEVPQKEWRSWDFWRYGYPYSFFGYAMSMGGISRDTYYTNYQPPISPKYKRKAIPTIEEDWD
jgi:hypothetical protein